MATINNAIAIMKDKDGNIGYFRSLSDNDIAKIKQYFSNFDALKTDFESFRNGATRIAFADYTQEANQASMEEGIIYLVPFTAEGVFIPFSEDTYQPADGTSVVGYFERRIKIGGTVYNLQRIYTHPDFKDLASLSGNNAFTGTNSFASAPTLTGTNDQTAAGVGANEFVTGKVAAELNTAVSTAQTAAEAAQSTADTNKSSIETINQTITEIQEQITTVEGDCLSLTVTETAPASGDDVAVNTIVAYPATDLLV